MLKFYTNPMSRGRIARWMLEEIGEPYEEEILTYGETMKSPEYLSINPMGKVPAIVHDGKTITECAAICAYLADAFPAAGLAPKASERADYYRWLFFTAGPVESALMNKGLGWEPEGKQVATVGYGNYQMAVDTLEKAVTAQPFIAGKRFTAADVYVGSQVGWGIQFKTLPERTVFQEYWARVSDRDALKRANEKDDALMPEAPAS